MMEGDVSWVPMLLPALLLLLCQLSCGARGSPATIMVPPSYTTVPGQDTNDVNEVVPPNATHTPEGVLEDASLSVPKLLKKYGYPAENHVVMTRDGYVLTLHRIPHGRKEYRHDFINENHVRSLRQSPKFRRQLFSSTGVKYKRGAVRQNKRAVLLIPGMFCSSAVYLIMGPKTGLGYILADAGYDVWIVNPRGNRYSMGHVEIPSSDDRYWQFSWHEMGVFDVPAVLEYVTEATGQGSVPVIGHSMGNTMMSVMGSERPEFNEKVSVHIALAPTVFLTHAQSPILKAIASVAPTLYSLLGMLGVHGFRAVLPLNDALKQLCREEARFTQLICKQATFMLLGFDPEQLNGTMFPAVLGHIPAGASTRTVLHYAQSHISGQFRPFDFGPKRNMAEYGQPLPPAYNLSNVDFPVAIMYGENDWLENPEDVYKLRDLLPNVVDFYRVPWDKFNHMDHLFAIDIIELEYAHVLEVLEKFRHR